MNTLYEAKTAQNNKPIMERVKTFEDACEVSGIDKLQIGIVGLDDDSKSIEAYAKLTIIAKALNQGWKPNWNDSNELKYYPWFSWSSSVGGFAYFDYDRWSTITSVSSRLCFKSSELAEYAGKQFKKEYNEFLTL